MRWQQPAVCELHVIANYGSYSLTGTGVGSTLSLSTHASVPSFSTAFTTADVADLGSTHLVVHGRLDLPNFEAQQAIGSCQVVPLDDHSTFV